MASSSPVELGAMIAGKYRVERVLGEGGMGVVVAAQHTKLHHRVAIKFLLPDVLAHDDAVARFAREARAAVRIQNEHVARVLDVGELENGAPYMVMEYLDGIDLADMIASDAHPSVAESIEYVLQACEAIAEAHSLGIVHRDLKPANLFVARRADGSPLVKVLDFGISKAADPGEHQLTKTQTFMGSVLYASPEQLLSARSVDVRTDIWSLGVILYQACAGVTPFSGESMMEIASRVMQLAPRPLGERRADLAVPLCSAIMRCLEKDPAKRFPNVGDLARALGPHAPRAAASVERISRLMPESRESVVDGLAKTAAVAPSPAESVRALPIASPPEPAIALSTQSAWDQQPGAPVAKPASRRLLVGVPLAAIGVAASIFALRSAMAPTTPPVPAASTGLVAIATSAALSASIDPAPASVSAAPVASASASASATAALTAPVVRPPPRASATVSAAAPVASVPPPAPEPTTSAKIKIR